MYERIRPFSVLGLTIQVGGELPWGASRLGAFPGKRSYGSGDTPPSAVGTQKKSEAAISCG